MRRLQLFFCENKMLLKIVFSFISIHLVTLGKSNASGGVKGWYKTADKEQQWTLWASCQAVREDVRPLWCHEGLFLSKSGPFYISPYGPERLSPMARVRLEIPALKGGEHTHTHPAEAHMRPLLLLFAAHMPPPLLDFAVTVRIWMGCF